ncbi:MAG: MBL fold metallo-hydrolase [Ardenticatenaceae bacterium]|nr:MBL fold metallo-hydrolase [Anaerolineales bacterium]MCB8921942.1 MBL fold metallo-hydrolase [Ardenticatenaceae bacterium]MCB8989517.1 MBL fold metallo-hydrolase [Ardenticatenaceae bacterium]MCB9003061.1 MBL fold metallo-hydrolase [Ardenticatenaceae bacterium]
MFNQQFFIEGLGCASYLIGCESQGVAAVIDPDRDVQKYLDTAQERGLQITHIIETHLHADHVSGNTDLARRTGAKIYVHDAAGAAFADETLQDGDSIKLGNVRLDVMHTPGHTPESITLLVSDTTRSEEPWLAFTGDTLFVGDIGRPDLVGLEAARQLAGDMHDSLFHKLLQQDDSLLILPGHGAGSLCGKSIGSMKSTTLGYERRFNPALAPRSRDEFVDYDINNLPEQPGNHSLIKKLNRQGPTPLGAVAANALTVEESLPHFQRGAAMLDLRSKAEFVQRHVPGAVHLEADNQLSNRIGYVLPPHIPIVLVVADEAQYREAVYSLARVGYEKVLGYLADSLEAWEALGLPVTSGDIQDIDAHELNNLITNGNGDRPVVVDVRESWEFQSGHIPDALSIPLGQISARLGEIEKNGRPIAVVCATGNRSQSAAALLGRNGYETVYNLVGGTSGWMMAGLPISRN